MADQRRVSEAAIRTWISQALVVHPRLYPRRIFGSFLCAQTGTRRQAKPGPGKPGWLFLPFLLALSKEMGPGKTRPKCEVLGKPSRTQSLVRKESFYAL